MKKKYLLILSTVLLLPLCACLNAIPELSEEDEAKVVRYMADVVLAHDQNYQARLLNEEEKQKALEEEAFKAEQLKKIEEEEVKLKEEKAQNNTPDNVSTSFASKSYSPDEINDYLGIDGVEFEFSGEEVVNKYPQNDTSVGFAFTASDQNKLMVVKFNIRNVSADKAYVDLATVNPKFRALINDSVKVNASKVPLDDVLNFFEGTIEAGDVKQVVLIYEIPEDTSIETLDLSLSAFGKDSIKINLQ
ncbi:MAG: DUF4352 domain-containing protein [Lachnospiraceae bacterium]|nr:DUF4352 domain-containing protein [Lachnospiraceae bacterium]